MSQQPDDETPLPPFADRIDARVPHGSRVREVLLIVAGVACGTILVSMAGFGVGGACLMGLVESLCFAAS
jgi:hypothetical protein